MDSDPYVIMSNGTRIPPSETDYADILRQELKKADASLTFQLGHKNQNWTRLLGTTNTQGRYINQSEDPCGIGVDMSTGRFVHVEQEYAKLRESESGWQRMTVALANTFKCQMDFVTQVNRDQPWMMYPNPFQDELYLSKDLGRHVTIQVVDVAGNCVLKAEPKNGHVDVSNIAGSGIYFVLILSQGQTIAKYKMLRVKS